jgi:hypothetical protein
MDKETLLALADMLDDAEKKGAEFVRMKVRAEKAEVEASELREKYRIVKHTADQAETRANTLDAMLKDAQEKAAKSDEQFVRMGRYIGILYKRLESAGIDAPTYTQFISGKEAEAALEIEEGEE